MGVLKDDERKMAPNPGCLKKEGDIEIEFLRLYTVRQIVLCNVINEFSFLPGLSYHLFSPHEKSNCSRNHYDTELRANNY